MASETEQLKLYFDFISQPSRALYIILKIGGKPFQQCTVDLMAGENLSDEFENDVNRFKKLPAIIDGEFKLAESIAILRYVSHKGYIPSYLYPGRAEERARVDEFLQWQHNGIRTSCSLYFRFLWVEARVFGIPAAPGKVEKYKRDMEKDLQLLETVWLKDKPFLTGQKITAADIFGACEVEQIRTCGYKVRDKFPKVAAWIESVRLQMHPHFDEAHSKVYEFERETENEINLKK